MLRSRLRQSPSWVAREAYNTLAPESYQCMSLFAVMSALMAQSGHSPKLDYASGTFGVRYHETLDFFRIKGALRCKANNFFGYDFN